MTKRDRLNMQVLSFRQLIYDAPEQNVPEIARLLDQVEDELRRLAHATQQAKRA